MSEFDSLYSNIENVYGVLYKKSKIPFIKPKPAILLFRSDNIDGTSTYGHIEIGHGRAIPLQAINKKFVEGASNRHSNYTLSIRGELGMLNVLKGSSPIGRVIQPRENGEVIDLYEREISKNKERKLDDNRRYLRAAVSFATHNTYDPYRIGISARQKAVNKYLKNDFNIQGKKPIDIAQELLDNSLLLSIIESSIELNRLHEVLTRIIRSN